MPDPQGAEQIVREIKPCPFCGHQPRSDNLDDSLHPETRDKKWWTFACVDAEGGCNAAVFGESAEECLERWNRRSALSQAAVPAAPSKAEVKRIATLMGWTPPGAQAAPVAEPQSVTGIEPSPWPQHPTSASPEVLQATLAAPTTGADETKAGWKQFARNVRDSTATGSPLHNEACAMLAATPGAPRG